MPRVALEHATIYRSATVSIRLIAVGAATLLVDGRPDPEASLAPGTRVEVGPYALTAEAPPAGADLAIAVELLRPLAGRPRRDQEPLAPVARGDVVCRSARRVDARASCFCCCSSRCRSSIRFDADAARDDLEARGHARPVVDARARSRRGTRDSATIAASATSCRSSACATGPASVAIRRYRATRRPPRSKSISSAGRAARRATPTTKATTASCAPTSGLCADCHRDLKRRVPGHEACRRVRFRHGASGLQADAVARAGDDDIVRIAQSDKAPVVEKSHLKFPHDAHLKQSIRGAKGRVTLDLPQLSCAGRERAGFRARRDEDALHRMPHARVRAGGDDAPGPAWLGRRCDDDDAGVLREHRAQRGCRRHESTPARSGARFPSRRPERSPTSSGSGRSHLREAKADKVAQDLFEARVCIVCHEVVRKTVAKGKPGNFTFDVAKVHVATTLFAEVALRSRQAPHLQVR